ncbi:MAG: NAD-dependent epimerase/dehydratase family protein [Acidimicrobiia bacterium]|nr:NAD-dependent epimerase/dehydratase family protein [Acidimicrobiia bacterium]
MRVLVTGIGGEIGTRVARLLEASPTVDAIAGIDREPPRRLLRRAEFHYLEPTDLEGIRAVIDDFAPTALVHLGVYEPHSRSTPEQARERTETGTGVIFDLLRDAGGIERVAVRSGIEIYGRGRDADPVPNEASPTLPSSRFGHMLSSVEDIALAAAADLGASVFRLRAAPISGAHMPSPFARYLRLPVVPVPMPPGHPFSLIHVDDVARALVAGLELGLDEALNLVGEGSVTVYEALRVGGRMPLPVLGPTLRFVRIFTEWAGSPLPDHTLELLTRGRLADGSRAGGRLGFLPSASTFMVVDDVYDWGDHHYMDLAPVPGSSVSTREDSR